MKHLIEAPTPAALADLVERCKQINRYATQLTAAEETRVAALASAIVVMRQVLELHPVRADRLAARQGRIQHWFLTGDHLITAETPAVKRFRGRLVLDEHEQVKILSHRSWRRSMRTVTLWRDGVEGLTSTELMEYLARLTALAQERAPDVARSLLERSEAIVGARELKSAKPRGREK